MKLSFTQFLSSISMLVACTQLHAADIRYGLLSYYPFDVSTTADVAFTNNFTAVPVGTPPALVTTNAAPRGSVLQLNGTSQLLRIDHPTDNNVNGLPIWNNGVYTIMMWVKGAPGQTDRYVFTEGNSTNNNPFFAIQTRNGSVAADVGKLDIIIRTTGGGTPINHRKSTATNVFDNTWHHIAWVDNRGTAKLYVDGVLDATDFNYTYTSGNPILNATGIGALVRASNGGFFNGAIDDLVIYERALSQSEVQQIMTNGLSYPVALAPQLLSEPVSLTKGYQDTAKFSVTATATRGNYAFTYQWNKNNSPIIDATNRTLRIFNLTTDNSGETYSVTVSNAVGATTSSNATLTVVADGPVDLRSGIISYWPLDVVTNDAGLYSSVDVYSRNDLILTNITDVSPDGQFSNSLAFEDPNAFAVRSGGSTIYRATGYSVSMWVKADGSFQADRRVFSEGSSTNNGTLFTIGTATPASPTGLARIYVRNDSNFELLNRESTRPVFDGTWHHIVWVDAGGQGKLYVDGVVDESDYTYTPSTLSPNVTSVGAVVRSGLVANTSIFGNVDEVATWNRPLTYADVQDLKTLSVPIPLAPTPPSIVTQPIGANLYTRANVTFTVVAGGTGPFSYQWLKGPSPLTGATNSTFSLSDLQLSDSGAYSVTVTGPGGTTNSQEAVLNVTQRPAPPASLAIDFNNRNEESLFTETGFDSFTLAGAGNTTLTTSRLFGGVEVVASGINGTAIDSRHRTTPGNSGNFTEAKLLQDFIFSSSTGSDGLDVTIKFMSPNQTYIVTLWSYDTTAGTGDRVSDWYVNGTLLKDNYTFVAANSPTNNAQYQFSVLATSDANGQIIIQGRRDDSSVLGASVFLNALRLAPTAPPSIIQQPSSRDVYIGTDISFSAGASGFEPITFQWFKGTEALLDQTNSILVLTNVQIFEVGSYSVTVSNQFGGTTSASATLVVSPRPSPQVSLGIDFNNRSAEFDYTQDRFESFTLDGTGAITLPTTHIFGGPSGVEVTVAGSNGTTVDSRRRLTPVDSADFTNAKMLQDFIFSPPVDGVEGLDVTLKFLTPNKPYTVTIWSFDSGNVGPRVSDWSANGVLVQNDFTFDGSFLPTNNVQYQFTLNTTSDSEGTIAIQGRREVTGSGVSVFLNALKVELGTAPLRVSKVERVGNSLRLTVQTPDSSVQHTVEAVGNLSNLSWSPVTGVTKTVINATTVRLEFAIPSNDPQFYRINLSAP